MTWSFYRVQNLSVDGSGNPLISNFSGAFQVSSQDPGVLNMWVIYGAEIADSHPRTRECLGIIYKDDVSNKYLVGAPNSIGPSGDTLDDVVDNDPGDWRTYKYSYQDGEIGHGRGKGFGDIPKGILVALGVGAPLPTKYLPFPIPGDCIGLKPEPLWSCGNFKAGSTSSIWYGNSLE